MTEKFKSTRSAEPQIACSHLLNVEVDLHIHLLCDCPEILLGTKPLMFLHTFKQHTLL